MEKVNTQCSCGVTVANVGSERRLVGVLRAHDVFPCSPVAVGFVTPDIVRSEMTEPQKQQTVGSLEHAAGGTASSFRVQSMAYARILHLRAADCVV